MIETNLAARGNMPENENETKNIIISFYTLLQHTTQQEVKFLNFPNHITGTKKKYQGNFYLIKVTLTRRKNTYTWDLGVFLKNQHDSSPELKMLFSEQLEN